MRITTQSLVNGQVAESHLAPGGAGEEQWSTFNLLSLDGGGIRGYWTLLTLRRLFHYIGEKEEQQGTLHSFDPESWPDNVNQADLSEEEERESEAAHSRRFLPCHYFDYICGSSTGALIAIMLGRFRMTIEDCLSEYRNLGSEVFGKPRMISTLRFKLGVRHKYKAARLEKVFQDICIQRDEYSRPGETSQIRFASREGLCATFVTTMKSRPDGRSSNLYLIRSYDYEGRDPSAPLRRPTPRTTMSSEQTNKDRPIDMKAVRGTQGMKSSLNYADSGKASQLQVWEVARAATAAKFYFEPLKMNIRGVLTEFTDGGFGPTNNPTQQGKQEIEKLHDPTSIDVVVSVGTARKPKENAMKATFFSTIPNTAREFADHVTDPEVIHDAMQHEYNTYKKFQYYRLNDPGGLQTELDEWEPKSKRYHKRESGTQTIKHIETTFSAWAGKMKNIRQLQECAAKLVECRRGRMFTSKWERYATGSHYVCPSGSCTHPRNIFDRQQFASHLKDHNLEYDELDEEFDGCRRCWRYQAPRRH